MSSLSPYQEIGQQHEILDQTFRNFWAEVDAIEAAKAAQEAAKKAEDHFWGFIESPESLKNREQLPEGHFRLEDVVKEPWCRRYYKTPPRLRKFLGDHGYPKRILELGLITRVGFDILIDRRLIAERESDCARKAKARAVERAAEQVPEPIPEPIIGAKRETARA